MTWCRILTQIFLKKEKAIAVVKEAEFTSACLFFYGTVTGKI